MKEITDVRETVDGVEVSASRKIQLDNYEPFEAFVGLTATKPDDLEDGDEFDQWVESLQNLATEKAEQEATRRFEEYVREEAFGDD